MKTPTGHRPRLRGRRDLVASLSVVVLLVACVLAGRLLLDDAALRPNSAPRLLPPGLEHPLGTDHLGRDLFTRVVKGLALSLGIGVLTAAISTVISAVLGICAALLGRRVDAFVSWLIDLSIGIPHLIFMILLAFTVGGGIPGLVAGIAFTHWMSLALLVRADVKQIRDAEFILVSRGLGRSPLFIARRHVLPLVLPQLLVGFVLMFPHVILHEAALTFLGFGFPPQTPAIGILLSEGMAHISSGMWWLAVFPGLALLLLVLGFARLGDRVRAVLDPATSNG
ncbi:peptide ABC transporter permease [Planomonospora parontospora subsp. parontospora]|uniref:Peptide ABC transporter permease n=2 Tax=Planomonospora parontospora TaxID=58119 RepID=A0AA37BKV2_9ACTN|nr:ABC transporter permease [Planomonospora parontospora]GGK83953.1 peptide ABC transporter permease [Planomonospora parontospora]GII10518.1 peptide ABC transporter permease [Planomonospora parontospora subsp. parontospora]